MSCPVKIEEPGYVAWSIDLVRRNGSIVILAVAVDHRRNNVGSALCGHAFGAMREHGVEVVEIGTGGDDFRAPPAPSTKVLAASSFR